MSGPAYHGYPLLRIWTPTRQAWWTVLDSPALSNAYFDKQPAPASTCFCQHRDMDRLPAGSEYSLIREPPMTRLKTAVFSLIPVIVLLLILEIAGRIIYPFDPDKRAMIKAERDPHVQLSYLSDQGEGLNIFYDIHRHESRYLPFLGWLGVPNTALATIRTNELGFRDRSLESDTENEYRIVILGGSTAWGLGASSNENTIAGAMESELSSGAGDNRSFRVINGAYPGWQSRQELVSLMEFHDEFDPDLVIAITGWNDMYVLTTGVDPDMQMRTESLMLAKAVKESLRPMSTMHAIRKVAGSMGVWRLVVHFREKMRLANPASSTVNYDTSHAARIIPGMADRYSTMADFAKRHGFGLIVALQPDIYTSGKTLTGEEQSVLNRYLDKYIGMKETYPRYRSDYLQNLRETMSAQGVQVVDLGGVFDHLSEPVFIDDCHFNDRGYNLIAEFLNERISGDFLSK